MRDEAPFFTTSDAARLCHVAGGTILLWANTGKLPAKRTANGMRLFRRADLERVMRERAERKART